MEKYRGGRRIARMTNKANFRTRTENNSADRESDEHDASPTEFRLPSLEITMKNQTAKQNLETMIRHQTKIDLDR